MKSVEGKTFVYSHIEFVKKGDSISASDKEKLVELANSNWYVEIGDSNYPIWKGVVNSNISDDLLLEQLNLMADAFLRAHHFANIEIIFEKNYARTNLTDLSKEVLEDVGSGYYYSTLYSYEIKDNKIYSSHDEPWLVISGQNLYLEEYSIPYLPGDNYLGNDYSGTDASVEIRCYFDLKK